MKNKTISELAKRLNEIDVEITNLSIEYNKIVNELYERLPNLKDDVNIQLKRRKNAKD